MLLKLNNSYLIKDKKQLKEFYKDLKTIGVSDKDNNYILSLPVNDRCYPYYLRITITRNGHCVYGRYPTNLPLTSQDLTTYQYNRASFRVPCQLYTSSKSIKYNKEFL